MKRGFSSLCAATLFALAGTASAADIDVMIQNQYLGTDLTPVITSPPELISQRVIEALENVAASLPAERLTQLAALVRQRSPHAVVLNEAFAYTCTDLPGTPVRLLAWMFSSLPLDLARILMRRTLGKGRGGKAERQQRRHQSEINLFHRQTS